MVENKTVCDWFWDRVEKIHTYYEEPVNNCYENMKTGDIVQIDDAYKYAIAHMDNMTDKEKQDFVDWFFSGDWLKIDNND